MRAARDQDTVGTEAEGKDDQASHAPGRRTRVPDPVKDALASESGAPLADAPRWSKEVGSDLSGARMVTGPTAAAAAQSIDARAFTVGERVFFGAGEYAPGTDSGDKLMRHELTHVAQQQGAAMPSFDNLRMSSAGDAVEQEARHVGGGSGGQVRAGGGVLIARDQTPKATADDFPTTAGGVRLNRKLDTSLDRFAAIRENLVKYQLSRIDLDYERMVDDAGQARPDIGKRFSDGYDDPMRDARDHITTVLHRDQPRRDTLLAGLYDDLAALGAEQFKKGTLNFGLFSANVKQVCGTYKHNADLADRRSQQHVDNPANNADQERQFRDRSNLFIDYSKSKQGEWSAATDRVLQGHAVDADKFAKGEDTAPVSGGQLLVYELLGEKLTGSTNLKELYQKVIDDVRRGLARLPNGYNVIGLLGYTHIDALIVNPIQAIATLHAADVDALHRARLKLAREIGEYLAVVQAENMIEATWRHLLKLDVIMNGAGASWTIPDDMNEGLNNAEDEAKKHKADEAKRAREEEEKKKKPTPAPQPEPKPAHVCRKFKGYEYSDIVAWMRSYWTNRKEFHAKHWDVQELYCMLYPGHTGEPPAQSSENLSIYRQFVSRGLGAIDKHMVKALARANEIHKLQTGLGFKVDKPEMIDAVGKFSLGTGAWGQLYNILSKDPLDPSSNEDSWALLSMNYFVELANYQNNLTEAAKLLGKAKKDKTDKWIQDRHADSFHLQVEDLRKRVSENKPWPGTDAELGEAEALGVVTKDLEQVFGLAGADRTAEHTREIEEEIYFILPGTIQTIRTKNEAKKKAGKELSAFDEHLELSDVWPEPLKDRLASLTQPGDDKIAQPIIQKALKDANAAHLEALSIGAAAAAVTGDTKKAEDLVSRSKVLGQLMGDNQYDASGEAVINWAKGEGGNLIAIFTMSEAAINASGFMPGNIMRAANLLTIGMEKGSTGTLGTTYRWLDKNIMFLAEEIANSIDATAKDPKAKTPARQFFQNTEKDVERKMVGWFLHEKLSVRGFVDNAFSVLEASKEKGALKNLIAVEDAGGGEKRKVALAALAARLDKKGGSTGLAAAKFVYAFALDAVHILDTDINKGDKNGKRSDAVKDLDAGKHPIHKRELSAQEKVWWQRYKDIKGEDNIILPGEQGWAEVGDFLKQLLAMAVLAWVSGGLAAGAAEMFSLGALATTLIEIGMFTTAMRFFDEMRTGQISDHSFAEDFLLNLAMVGASKLAAKGFERVFLAKFSKTGKLPTSAKGKAAYAAGDFVFEYLATSIVSLAHMAGRSAVTGKELTLAQVKTAMLHNFAFLAAFKGFSVLGPAATATVEAVFKKKGGALGLPELLTTLRSLDEKIAKETEVAKAAKDTQAGIEAMQRQRALIEQKAKVLETSGVDGAAALGANLRSATELYKADVAASTTMTDVRARPDGDSPHFTYEASPHAEAALATHFGEAGMPYKKTPGLEGATFEVVAGGGTTIFRPRAVREGAGTSAGTFTRTGRIEADRIGTSRDVMSVMKKADGIRHDAIPATENTNFSLGGAPHKTNVQVKAVDDFSVSSPHESGPVRSELKFDGGEFQVLIEVKRNTSNDQIVRGVNHEIAEQLRTIARAVEEGKRTGQGVKRYSDPAKLNAVVTAESSPSALKAKGKQGQPSGHDMGTIQEARDMGLQLEKILAERENPRTSADELAVLEQRLELLLKDMRKMWNSLGLPTERAAFKKRLEVFDKAGIKLSDRAISQLETMRASRGEAKGIMPGLTELHVQVVFDELKKTMPDKLPSSTYLDLWIYYQGALRDKVQAAMKGHSDPAKAIAAGKKALKMEAGQKVAAWAGYAFEGLTRMKHNSDPRRVADRGHMYEFEASFKDFDGICIKGPTSGEFKFTYSESGKRVTIRDENGTRIYEGGGSAKEYIHPKYEIWKVSMKAKDKGTVDEMRRALGTPDAPSDHGMIVSAEYFDWLVGKIKRQQERVADLKAGGAAKKSEWQRAREDLRLLQFFKDRIEVGMPHSKLRALIEELKAAGLEVQPLIDEFKLGKKKGSP